MSLTESKSSLKKILSIIEEINNLNNDSIPKLQAQPNNILGLIENFEELKTSNLKTTESNDDEINSLKNKISQNQRGITVIEEKNNEFVGERQVLLNKIQTAQNELTVTQEKINVKKEELEIRTNRLEELESRIVGLKDVQEVFENKMREREAQLQEEHDKKEKLCNSFGMRIAAMKSLIKAGYIQSAQLKVINSLVPETSLELGGLVKASGLREDVFKKVLLKIVEENGPLEYDEAGGTILLKEEVDF
ncbi:hypothetical protein LCGC14_0837170 [marine sediment metagenome]|uniref:V-SNARE coiled-coil homology domain-containing protein n=1 Tax=marine sediment metagenome TaxID=412755 RepID=A0A0F9PE71_9ZZZZ